MTFHDTIVQLEKGLSLFREKYERAMKNELTQLHYMETFIPMEANKIVKQDRKEESSSLIIFAEESD